jgi:two-component system NtrC family sensor kinase
MVWQGSSIEEGAGSRPERSHSAVRPLRMLLVASIVVPALVFTTAAWISYRTLTRDTIELVGREADVLKEHATKVFETAGLVLTEIGAVLAALSEEEARAAEPSLHERLAKMVRGLPQFRTAWIVASDGGAMASTSQFPTPRLPAEVADIETALPAPDNGLLIGEIVTGRVEGNRSFTIAARYGHRDGARSGAIILAVAPEYFERVYEKLVGGRDGIAGMVRADGTMLVRLPSLEAPSVLSPRSQFMQSITRAPDGGFYETRSELDGIDRLFAYRRLDKLPIYVYAARDRSVVIGQWAQEMASHLFFGAPATLALFLITLVALRRTAAADTEAARREVAEAALQQAKKMEALGQLTGGVAHDFNNLLLVLNGNLDLIKQRVRPEQQKSVAAMERALLRAEALTRQLLAFARRKPLRSDRVNLVGEMPKVLETLGRSIRGNIAFESEIPADLWPIEADLGELELALLNLAVNARDAMPSGGTLRVSAANVAAAEAATLAEPLSGDFVRIAVADTGCGIAPEHLERVFDPFFTTKPAERGTGLGLSQVHGFAKQSRGTAVIRSRPGEGTTVEIYLPRAAGVEAPVRPLGVAMPSIAGAPRDRIRILVVDDNIEVGETTVAILADLGYRARFVIGGAEALRTIAADPADIVIADMVMPAMSGIELARVLRGECPDLPILLATGYSEAVPQARRAGFPLVIKPYRADRLDRAIQEMLGGAGRPVADEEKIAG